MIEMKIIADARRRVIDECLAIVDGEEEMSGPMPDEMRMVPIEDALRAAVRATKKSIRRRIAGLKK